MTRALLLGSGMALSVFLAGCGKDVAPTDSPKEWKAYQPPVQTGALAGSGAITASGSINPKVGTGSIKQ